MSSRVMKRVAVGCLLVVVSVGLPRGPALAAEEPAKREVAAEVPPAVQRELERLRSRDPKERANAAYALADLGDARALDPLAEALKDESREVRFSAAWALAYLRDKRGIAPLVAVLREDDEQFPMTMMAAGPLIRIGKASVEPLIGVLKDAQPRARYVAAQALGRIGDPRAVAPLTQLLGDENEDVRKEAADALGQIGTAAVVALTATLSSKGNPIEVRAAAARALRRIRDPRAVEALLAALDDPDALLRQHAADALGYTEDARAVGPLIAALRDASPKVRERAAQALRQRRDPEAVEALLAALHDQEPDVRSRAAQALGEIRDRQAVEPLLAALGDEAYQVRWNAAEALGQIKDTRAVEPLIDRVQHDSNDSVRWAAAGALGYLEDKRAVPALVPLLGERDYNLREKAMWSLRMITGQRSLKGVTEWQQWWEQNRAAYGQGDEGP